MDVTKSNFQSVLDSLDEVLEKASFLAIDTELTGLQDGDSVMSPLDTPEERYQKIRQGGMKFLIIQFGLSVFNFVAESKKYVHRTYNFYVFPNPNPPRGYPDPKFLSQTSCLGFLVSQGFDFNKLFREGIPYLNMVEEEKMKAVLIEKQKITDAAAAPNNYIPSIPVEQKSFMEEALGKIESFFNGDEEQLILEDCSAYQRKLIFTHGKKKFPGAYMESKITEKHERVIIVQKSTPEQLQQLQEKSDLKQLDTSIGFTKVFRKISDSGKLVVGHNMLLDLCHILNQFYAELPADYEEFKVMANAVFPRLIDTKVMASTSPFRERLPNTSLEPLLKALTEKPFRLGCIESGGDFPCYSLSSGKAHEAGYDAFMTGSCFIAMANLLGDLSSSFDGNISPEAPFITPFLQKVHMMRVQDIPYMNLTDRDLDPARDHVFYMTVPAEWKTSDIFQLFSVYGPVMVTWFNRTSAFVSLHRKENRDLIMKNILPPPGCTLLSYSQYVRTFTCSLNEVAPAQPTTALPCQQLANTCEAPVTKVSQGSKRQRATAGNNVEAKKQKKNAKKKTQFVVPDDWE